LRILDGYYFGIPNLEGKSHNFEYSFQAALNSAVDSGGQIEDRYEKTGTWATFGFFLETPHPLLQARSLAEDLVFLRSFPSRKFNKYLDVIT